MANKTNRPSFFRLRNILIMIAGVGLIGAVCFCSVLFFTARTGKLDFLQTFDSAEFTTLTTWSAHPDWETLLQLQFPDSTQNIKIVSDGFQDPYYHLKFEIDPTDLDAFIETSLCEALNPQPDSIITEYFATQAVDWWTPESATSYQSCSTDHLENSFFFTLFIDQSNPATFAIYITAIFT